MVQFVVEWMKHFQTQTFYLATVKYNVMYGIKKTITKVWYWDHSKISHYHYRDARQIAIYPMPSTLFSLILMLLPGRYHEQKQNTRPRTEISGKIPLSRYFASKYHFINIHQTIANERASSKAHIISDVMTEGASLMNIHEEAVIVCFSERVV